MAKNHAGRGATGLVILPAEKTTGDRRDLQCREQVAAHPQRRRTAGLCALAGPNPVEVPGEYARKGMLMVADPFPEWIGQVIGIVCDAKAAISIADLNSA